MSSATATPIQYTFGKTGQSPTQTTKSDINALILDYLTVAGYPRAAAKFSTEANLEPHQDNHLVAIRQQIQNAIHKGMIREAIEAINDLDPEILDGDETLHFALLRLQLVELIRECTASGDGDIGPALTFAQAYLAPRAPTNDQFLEALEKTMALLVFPHDKLSPDLARLLDPTLREEVADRVNNAILERQSMRREAAIAKLVHVRAWAGNQAKDRGIALRQESDIKLSLDRNGNNTTAAGLDHNDDSAMNESF